MTSYFTKAKDALKKQKKHQDDRGLNVKHNYSSFWMGNDREDRFSGLPSQSYASSDLVKLIKLVAYRKAVTNFVKILTNREIPVYWAGDTSFTNGKSICLTTDIKETNFDVTVGLALHEASHIILTDFEFWKLLDPKSTHRLAGHPDSRILEAYRDFNDLASGMLKTHGISHSELIDIVRNLLNWIEDRRIDHYVFTTSPGYKAYYHKLYDHYWNSKIVLKGLLSSQYRKPHELESYLFQIFNSLNPNFDSRLLPGLTHIIQTIDVQNIDRLKSTQDAFLVSVEVTKLICNELKSAKDNKVEDIIKAISAGEEKDTHIPEEKREVSNEQNNTKQSGGEKDTENNENNGEGDSNKEINLPPMESLTTKELNDLEKLFSSQKNFAAGDSNDKKSATKSLQSKLQRTQDEAMTVQAVGEGTNFNFSTIVWNLKDDESKLAALEKHAEVIQAYKDAASSKTDTASQKEAYYVSIKAFEEIHNSDTHGVIFRSGYHGFVKNKSEFAYIQEGLNVGALLARKLRIHNESRERVDNRLITGKLDIRRISGAGYGVQNIFKQVSIDKYKKAVLHISIDCSGSMSGTKLNKTKTAVVAIARAINDMQNIELQLSLRYSTDSGSRSSTNVFLVNAYDSTQNSLQHLIRVMTYIRATGSTPEGLCYEAMLKQNLLTKGNSEMNSYFINFSDGEPAMGGYTGTAAVRHTAKWIKKIKERYNIEVLSYYITSSTAIKNFNESHSGTEFKLMYGKDSTAVNVDSLLELAKSLNNKFLQSKLTN